jgi:2-haloalkanoic acid dehalogenase type II
VSRLDAVLLDAFGTLVEMEPPAPLLRSALAARGFEIDLERAGAAFGAEIGYYLEHQLEGRDPESLDDLRDRCADVLREALGLPGLDHAEAREVMLASIRFGAFADSAPALRELRGRGLRLVVTSNWDCSLDGVLADAGLLDLVDGVVSSATAGVRKPDPRLFAQALELAGCPAERAVHVGDSPSGDVGGATAAGIRAVLLQRGGERLDGVPADAGDGTAAAAVIASLAELPGVL